MLLRTGTCGRILPCSFRKRTDDTRSRTATTGAKDIMDNPWINLPKASPYVLPEDRKLLDSFNYSDESRPHTEILPAPYMGRPESARVFLLSLNPGFKEWDVERERTDLDYDNEKRKSLTFQSRCPWFILDPSFSGTPGRKWWFSTLRIPIETFGLDRIVNSVMCVQYFPYQSSAYKQQHIIPSQLYSFELVKAAMKANKLIIQFRGDKYWENEVLGLDTYETKVIIRSQETGQKLRKASISGKNMSTKEWHALSNALTQE